MRYELLYYELKEKKFNSETTLKKFLNKLTDDQKLRLIKKENGFCFLFQRTPQGFKL